MKLYYTEQALQSLKEALDFLGRDLSHEKRTQVLNKILDKADLLVQHPNIGQVEENLLHLGLSHRRIIVGNYKIIYRVAGEVIYVTDIFDCRQDPSRMKA